MNAGAQKSGAQDFREFAGRPAIIGAGLAGMMVALRLAPHPVLLISPGPLGCEASSELAQGGMAAVFGADDSLDLHLTDTLMAGDGLTDPYVAKRILAEAPRAIEALARMGVAFDYADTGAFLLGLEAAHQRRRIVHAGGDAIGAALMAALSSKIRQTPSIALLEGFTARRLIMRDHRIAGVVLASEAGVAALPTGRIVLATGGVGGLFEDSTNPLGCFGQGLALAARAGAEFQDIEFIQFHPTALDGSTRPMRLISEAVRGEGAVIVDDQGRRFLAALPGAELAPRDMVARGVFRHLVEGGRAYLDAREAIGPRFPTRFPTITKYCNESGFDPSQDLLPIRPAAHYHMGGVAVDDFGRSSIEGLWACGEVASTGLHGANRLASNSLTEAAVCAGWIADSILDAQSLRLTPVANISAAPFAAPDPTAIRLLVARHMGVIRDEIGLNIAIKTLAPLAFSQEAASDPALVALMIATAALQRKESRGAHFRSDYPQKLANATHQRICLEDVMRLVHPHASPVYATAF